MTHQTGTQILEAQMQRKSTAPRVTERDVDAAIVSAQYHHFPDTTVTVCVLTLRNGHTVVGKSACVHAENFDAAIGREFAFTDARHEVWAVLGYELRIAATGTCLGVR